MPGINGPSGLAGTRDADTMLGELLDALKEQGLDKTTDVFVTADHGFTTISHASATSPSAHFDPGAAAERSAIRFSGGGSGVQPGTCRCSIAGRTWRQRWISAMAASCRRLRRCLGGSRTIPMWWWRPMAAPT